jgi:hypothetical protein
MPPLDGLVDVANTQCVAGCYRCLLSYYNQPDHPGHRSARPARPGTAAALGSRDHGGSRCDRRTASRCAEGSTSPLAGHEPGPTFDAAAHGLPAPDRVRFDYDGTSVLALWRAHRVALLAGDAQAGPLSDKGLTCIAWPADHQQQDAALASLRQHLG